MSKLPLFRKEALDRATRRLDGKVLLFTPVSIQVTSLLLVIIIAISIVFAFLAEFTKKETVRGWVTWSTSISDVRARENAVILAVSVQEGDWVREGQVLAWADTSRLGAAFNPKSSGSLIQAPVSGRLLTSNAKNGMVTNAETILFTIAPEGGNLIARMMVPSRSLGFISLDQEVRLAVDAYPYQKFGTLNARISRISGSAFLPRQLDVPFTFQEASYVVDAELKSDTIAAYGKQFGITNGMQFSANIVIDRRSLIEWLLDPLYAAGRESK
jgi:multidrug efflux pump subunit AcrA (membrane-fusion protein)